MCYWSTMHHKMTCQNNLFAFILVYNFIQCVVVVRTENETTLKTPPDKTTSVFEVGKNFSQAAYQRISNSTQTVDTKTWNRTSLLTEEFQLEYTTQKLFISSDMRSTTENSLQVKAGSSHLPTGTFELKTSSLEITPSGPPESTDVIHMTLNMGTTAAMFYQNPNLEVMEDYIKSNRTVQLYLASFTNEIQRHAVEIQLKICPYVTLCDFPVNIVTTEESCCQKCSCNPSCVERRTCCPNLRFLDEIFFKTPSSDQAGFSSSSSSIPVDGQDTQIKQCTSMHLTLRPSFVQKAIYLIASCPNNGDTELRNKCTRRYSEHTRFTDFLPVFANKTLTVYRNKYCALCNDVKHTEIVFFKPSFSCSRFVKTLMNDVASEKDITKLLFASEDCDVMFNTDDSRIKLESCDYSVSMCNVTGLWQTYDPAIEQACLAYRSLFQHDIYTFQNVFCAMCNGISPHTVTCFYMHPIESYVFSFSGLMRLDHEQAFDSTKLVGDDEGRCSQNQIYDQLMEECKDLFCPPMKTLHDGTCSDLFDFLGGRVSYSLYFRLIPLNEISLIDLFKLEIEIYNEIYSLFNSAKGAWMPCYMYLTFTSNNKYSLADISEQENSFLSHADGKIILESAFGNQQRPYMVFEEIQVLLAKYFSIEDNLTGNVSFRLILKESDDRIFQITDILTQSSELRNALSKASESSERFYLVSKYTMPSADGLTVTPSSIFYYVGLPCEENRLIIDLQRFSSCLKTNMSRNNYFWRNKIDGIEIGGVTLNSFEYYHIDQNHIMLCADSFQKIVSNMLPVRELSAEIIVSIVSSGLSVTALFISVIVYCSLTELRETLPGKNNIALMSSMFVAQILLLVGSLYPFQQYSVGCKMVGVMIHFSWLCCIFWMNVCTYHVFRVLTSNNPVQNVPTRGRFFCYIIYVIFMAAIFVSANILVSISVSGQFGYGGKFCYITSQTRIMYTFALPALLIVIINLSLFLSVIRRIRKSSGIQKNVQNERNEFLIFIKLSIFTGITWTFGFLYMWTGIMVFSYLFITINASQGVFIMIAFVINRRVFSLLKKWSKEKSAASRTSSGGLASNNIKGQIKA